jgi:hypothetical protein
MLPAPLTLSELKKFMSYEMQNDFRDSKKSEVIPLPKTVHVKYSQYGTKFFVVTGVAFINCEITPPFDVSEVDGVEVSRNDWITHVSPKSISNLLQTFRGTPKVWKSYSGMAKDLDKTFDGMVEEVVLIRFTKLPEEKLPDEFRLYEKVNKK